MNSSSHIYYINNQISPPSWTREQEKQFERGIVMFLSDENDPNRWHKVASYVGDNKTAAEVYQHYQDLVRDIKEIEEGRVELPSYYDGGGGGDDNKVGGVRETTESELAPTQMNRENNIKKKQQSGGAESERKKGIPWTEEEHRAFLYGLEKYGKGDWRSISRNAVQTRTPTQVASHAQKYFLRLNAEKKERKRSSIHDITTVEKVSKVSSDRPVQRMKTMDSLLGSFPRQGDYFGCH